MSLFSCVNPRRRSDRTAKRRALVGERRVAKPTSPAEAKIADFGAAFVAAMRRRTSRSPKPLRIHDVVDVFADTGEFLYRGVVEGRDETHAWVRAHRPSQVGPTIYRTKISSTRYADAAPPPRTLAEWEAARGGEPSQPPK